MSQQPALPPTAPVQTVPGPGRNLLSADVEIKGTLQFRNDLIAHGKIDGEVLTEARLTVGKTGTVQGDIHAGSVAIHGIVNGNVTVTDRCELKGEAQLLGDLEGPTLVMEEGATFVGRANVTPAPQPDLVGQARGARRS
jgi:cytoskeletal protein CcmA (bactofilin family)